MILTNGRVFILNTNKTSYIFHVDKTGLLLHDYYGDLLDIKKFDISAIEGKYPTSKGTSTIYKEEIDPNISMDHVSLEFSFPHKGDYRVTPILLKNDKHGYVFDFNFDKYEIIKNPIKEGDMPSPKDMDEELRIYLIDKAANVEIVLSYLVDNENDVIARNIEIINKSELDLDILKALSYSLDIVNKDYEVVHFTGAWASEMHENVQQIKVGRIVHESLTGNSSNKTNPLFLIKNKETTLDSGDIYIFNLIYSGNHINEIELNSDNYLRIEAGISNFSFDYKIKKDEVFITPYAVFTYSCKGINFARHNMHNFVNKHIVNKEFKECLRPVVINNWEGTYFKFNEAKLLKIASGGKNLGAELFVLDDGWFSSRNDDLHGLGDYDVNKKKLPHGLVGLGNKIRKLGLKFGLWFEPESINISSKLYESHPDWVISNNGHEPSKGRHQLLLDLSKKEVQDYIIANISTIIEDAKLDYIKWDMNRNMSDIPCIKDNGTFYHNYILGLYRVMRVLTSAYPNVLFEGCASGGNRFDLGILSYFPQIWCSDNTDAYERLRIQKNLSYGYPLSTLSNHVSSSPNMQTLRVMPLTTRFAVAMFGVCGYELLAHEMSKDDKKESIALMNLYKKYKEVFQYGDFYEIDNHDDKVSWQVISKDKKTSIVMEMNILSSVSPKEGLLKAYNLNEGKSYKVSTYQVNHDIRSFGGLINMVLPFHINPEGGLINLLAKFKKIEGEKDEFIVDSAALINGNVRLSQEWSASGQNNEVRILRDFGSRLYIIEEVDETN